MARTEQDEASKTSSLPADAQGEPAPPGETATYTPSAIHMVRTATTANMMLSQMADQKASILMGANFVVFTIAIGQTESGRYPISLICLAIFAFVSAMFAIAAVVPSVKARPLPTQQANILFFGVFSQLREQEFIDQVLRAGQNEGRILSTMLRDIHQNGLVLQRKKYRYLAYAYRVFQAGLCLTLLVFVYENKAMLTGLLG